MFEDRGEAGRRLAVELMPLREEDPVVVALPLRGAPVAAEVAFGLQAPLDVVVVRPLRAPGERALQIGAVGEGGVRVVDHSLVSGLGVTPAELRRIIDHEAAEVEKQAGRFRRLRPQVPVVGRTAILIDDGLDRVERAAVAARILRRRNARRIVLAVPLAMPAKADEIRADVDEVISLEREDVPRAIADRYKTFPLVSEDDVARLLRAAAQVGEARRDIEVAAGRASLPGEMFVPSSPTGVVLFAHGSGSSRLSPRNRAVAATLEWAGFATFLFDLLTDREAFDRQNVFDVDLLGSRLVAATRAVREQTDLGPLPIGFFGASTGAAAALWAATEPGVEAAAIVSRGGRPDLAGARLAGVRAPTLLIVGGADTEVLQMNERAQAQLTCPNRLEIVPEATHLFEEPGALERVAELARDWFGAHLSAGRPG